MQIFYATPLIFFFCENFLLLIISYNNVGLEQKASKSLHFSTIESTIELVTALL